VSVTSACALNTQSMSPALTWACGLAVLCIALAAWGPSGNRHELDPPLRPWRAGASTDRRNGLTSLTGGSAAGDATREPRPPSRAAIVKRQPSGCLPTMAPPTLPRRPAGAVGRQQTPAAVVVVPDPPRRAARL